MSDDLHHPAVYHRGDNILKLSHLLRGQCVRVGEQQYVGFLPGHEAGLSS